MPELFAEALKQGGLVGAIAAALVVFLYFGFRALWRQNQTLHRQLKEVQEGCAKKTNELQEAHAKLLNDLHEQHAKLLNMIQERRIEQAHGVTERVVNHLGLVDRTMEKVHTSLDLLIDMSRRS